MAHRLLDAEPVLPAPSGEPWRRAHRAGRDESLTTSTIVCVALIPPIVVAMSAYMAWIDPTTGVLRMSLGGTYVAVCAVFGALWRRGILHRHAASLSLAFVLMITGLAAAYWHWLPDTARGATSTLLVIQMGGALLFPWGPYRQTLLSIGIIGEYAWLVGHEPQVFDPYSASLLVATVPLMTFASHLIERYRSAAFLRDWQKDVLVSLARALGAELDPSHVSAITLEHAIRLLGADTGAVVLRVPERGTFRIEALGDRDSPWAGQEITDDFGLAQRVGEAGVLMLPHDDPTNPLLPLLAAAGTLHALHAAIRDGGDVIGAVAVSRRTDVPFKDADRALARAVADHAGLALRTARLVRDLREANQLKSEFVSTMSHELRTPLNVILGYAEVARDTEVDSASRDDCLVRIDSSARDLLELIESTLEIGKIEAGRQEVRREPVRLPAFWSQLGDACRRLPRRPTVELAWSADPPPVTVDTDPRKLTLVVRNLVGNALKFTERGHVRVELGARAGRLVVRVADTGIGISQKDIATIFEMFRQADGSDTRRFGGVGLGLYIVRQTVDQLGGTVELESELGVGTTFTVSLPCAEAAPALSAA
jgi:signal transduction histidine kinase